MRFAVLDETERFVDNVIVAQEGQQAELEASLGRKLLNAAPDGLLVGDYYNGSNWTRNIDGEQVALPITVDSADAAEALAILSGEVE